MSRRPFARAALTTARATAMAAAAAALVSCAPDSRTTAPEVLSPRADVVAPSTLVGTLFINEVESNQGVPGDWIELYNAGGVAIDLSGFAIKDNDNSRTDRIPAGTVIPAGGYLVLDENSAFSFGLGSADAARLYGADGTTLIDSYQWASHATTTYARCPDGSAAWGTSTQSTKGAANTCGSASASIKLNEVESNGDAVGDWVEFYNTSAQAIDLSGYVFRDNDNTHSYTLPVGTTIAANGYLVLLESDFGFGLGAADEARLFAPGAVTLVDSYSWTSHASTTYGRCPNGTGAFATTTTSTRGTVNQCAGDITYLTWPGDNTVRTVDAANTFGSNMSGLFYQPVAGQATGVVWAVKNGPGTLYRLTYVNGQWTPRASRLWSAGKALRYPDGTGDVDAEGVVARGSALYVSSERNNSASGTSRLSILRYNTAVETGATLVATHEWNVTAALPAVGANLGLEGITYIPDSFLTARGFYDEQQGRAYNPADYANHEGGLFFVAVEGTGVVHAFALNHVSGAFTRIASFAGGFSGAMDLAFDAELGQLWVVCDDTCQGRTAVFRLDTQTGSPTQGRFTVRERFERPTDMPNTNNEGFTFAPLAECVNGRRPVLWSDDNQVSGFALRQGTLTCTPF